MHQLFRPVFVATALALSPLIASAGPISWNYTGTVTGNKSGTYDYGPTARPDSTSPTGLRYGEVVGQVGTVNGSGAHTDAARLELGGLLDGTVWTQWHDTGRRMASDALSDQVLADLTITDAASGAQGHFWVTGTGDLTGDPMLSAYQLSLLIDGNANQERTIGGNRYRVHFDTEVTASGAMVVADVSVASATPEPGTLALAALGFSALGIIRLRRR